MHSTFDQPAKEEFPQITIYSSGQARTIMGRTSRIEVGLRIDQPLLTLLARIHTVDLLR